MAGSKCYYCQIKRSPLLLGTGTKNEPLGVCVNCHTLVCGWHGQRDNNVPEFICLECIIPKLVASALDWDDENDTTQTLINLYSSSSRSSMPAEVLKYSNIEDFEDRTPQLGKQFFRELQISSIVTDKIKEQNIRMLFEGLSNEKMRLITAANLMVRRFKIPSDEITSKLKFLTTDLLK